MELYRGFELDDVLLVPRESKVNSRSSVDLGVKFGHLCLDVPIVASPMAGIVGVDIIKGISEFGGIGILHRFFPDVQSRKASINSLLNAGATFGVAVGLDDYRIAYDAIESGVELICVDIANGYIRELLNNVEVLSSFITKNSFNVSIMSGNVCTFDGARNLYSAGASIVRVGLGTGTLCTTRTATGVGLPQFTALMECAKHQYTSTPWDVVADGGIKTSGDAVKAIACGAKAVMLGTLFSKCFESDHNGKISGMASREHQENFYGVVEKSVEGIQKTAEKTVSLKTFLEEFVWNMKSALTYLDSGDIITLQKNAKFVARR